MVNHGEKKRKRKGVGSRFTVAFPAFCVVARAVGRFQPYFLGGLGCPSTVAIRTATDNALG
jgi:hypothetical protein